jgi:ATPase subunit of ABC transporter with duplicated ATPase domains
LQPDVGSSAIDGWEIQRLRHRLEDALAERDAYAQELFETNRYAGELTAQRQALIDREKAALDREKAALDREKAALDREKAALDRVQAALDRVQAADDRVQAADDRIAAIHASTSWRLTKPIRFAKRQLWRIFSGGGPGVNS